jgi:hypothetical protein
MKHKFAKRIFHLTLLVAVVCSALFGAFDISSPFTASAFTDGYPGASATCCTQGSDCPNTTDTCRVPVGGERYCSPSKHNYCQSH